MATVGKIAISIFILMHLVVWGWRHSPAWSDRIYWNRVDHSLPATTAEELKRLPFYLNWYAHKVGMDNRWEMYSSVWRSDWTIIAIGIDADGQRVLLPEPLQSPRTWFQHQIVDFREAKYQIHLTRWPSEQQGYVNYLLRRYPSHNGVAIKSIILELRWRPYVESTYEAQRTGSHFAGPEYTAQIYPPPEVPK